MESILAEILFVLNGTVITNLTNTWNLESNWTQRHSGSLLISIITKTNRQAPYQIKKILHEHSLLQLGLMTYNLAEIHWPFTGMCYLHLQGRRHTSQGTSASSLHEEWK
jgi:hypothetical protein